VVLLSKKTDRREILKENAINESVIEEMNGANNSPIRRMGLKKYFKN
jgi:hypothetical protein